MYSCPKFHYCNAPMCPLDKGSFLKTYIKGECKCTLGKIYRKKLGYNLPTKGLLPSELGGIKAWEKRNELSKTNTLKNLALRRDLNTKASNFLKPNYKAGESLPEIGETPIYENARFTY